MNPDPWFYRRFRGEEPSALEDAEAGEPAPLLQEVADLILALLHYRRVRDASMEAPVAARGAATVLKGADWTGMPLKSTT